MTARALRGPVALVLLLTGCPGGTAPPQPSPPVVPRGSITIAYPAEPATLDPFLAAGESPATRDLVRLLMPALWRIGPDGSRERWLLAAEPEVLPGEPFSVRMRLRPDARWSDGRPITVEDLRATRRVAMDPSRMPASRDGYDHIERIVAESPTVARVEFKRPYRRWPDLFGAGLGVLPAHLVDSKRGLARLGRRWPVSGGPFVLERWRRGLDMTFVANTGAWDATPHLERIRVVFMPSATGALRLLREGRVDALGPYLAEDWLRRASDAGEVSSDQGATWGGILFNARDEVLDDHRVRRALLDSLDRERLARGFGGEDAALELGPGPEAAAIGDADEHLPRARRLLARAGWTGGPIRSSGGLDLSFGLAFEDVQDLPAFVTNAVVYHARRAGIEVDAVPLDPAVFWGEWLEGPEFEAAFVVWRDPPLGGVRAHVGTTGAGRSRLPGRARLRSPELDRALAADDRNVEGQATRAARPLRRLAPVVPLLRFSVTIVTRAGIEGVAASAEADGPFWNVEDWRLAG